ncbi:hypothetical protein [Anabaena sp. CCY 9910]|uniref:hypothetical protein n=1 Tax=Anabaena sp. CCY 9910 TaxID=3103870 RepID=UPI0039E0F684
MKLRRKSNRDDSIWRLRYGSPTKYKNLCKTAHEKTYNLCCCCVKRKSVHIHHAYYGNDVIGESIFPVCMDCHYFACHHKDNWIRSLENPIWENRNTEEFTECLRLGYKALVNKTAPIFELWKQDELLLQQKKLLCERAVNLLGEIAKSTKAVYDIKAIVSKQVINLEEASTISGLSKNFLSINLKSGKLHGEKINKDWKIRPDDLQTFVDKCFN